MFYSISTEEVFVEIKRTMKYGAPELKSFYQRFLIKGLSIAILIHVILISGYFISISLAGVKEEDNKIFIPKKIDVKELETSSPISKIPVEPIKDISFKDLSALTPEPVMRRNVTEEVKIKNQKELENIHIPVSSNGTDDISRVNINSTDRQTLDHTRIEQNIKPIENIKNDYKPFEVDKAPSVVNLSSVRNSMRYPEIALRTGIEGKVVVQVLVGKDGSISKVGKISGPEEFYEEVKEKVTGLRFTGALKNNEPVNCWVSVPFNFTLKKSNKPGTNDDLEDAKEVNSK